VLVLGLALAWFARFLIWKLHSIDPIREQLLLYSLNRLIAIELYKIILNTS
jgi:hypothetical protein